MNTAANIDVFIRFVDLLVIVVAILMLSYGVYRGYKRYRQSLPSGGVLIACGLSIIVFTQLSDLAFEAISPGTQAVRNEFYSAAWYDWLLSRLAIAFIAVGFVITVVNRRRTEKRLRSNLSELESLRNLDSENDERVSFYLDHTPNSMYCYEFDPPMSVNLPIEEQIARSHDATLVNCNVAFASELGARHPADVIGRKFGSLDSSRDISAHSAYFRAFIENGYKLSDYELSYICPDGQQHVYRIQTIGTVKKGCLERLWAVDINVGVLRKTQVALERRQTYLALFAWVSSQLVTATDDTSDTIVKKCIEEICRYFDADRSSIFWIAENGSNVANIAYYWSAHSGIVSPSISLKLFPAFMDRLSAKQPVRIDSVAAMTDKFEAERTELENRNVKALIILPMVVADELVGGMTVGRFVSEVPWSDDDVQDAVVLSELLANFVLRLKSHRALDEALRGLRKATDRLEAENVYLREEASPKHGFAEIIGESRAILRTLRLVEQVAGTRTPVLVLGETGTGKELIARAIHNLSDRRDRALVKINCAALPANLIESELFGHEKGAFTGATGNKRGRFEIADKSTLFLDEFGEIPVELQAKLLRVLQEGEFERLGGARTLKVDVRIVVATNRDLDVAVQRGQFRSDLYYRINTFPIELPALRDRGVDIDLLAEHFVRTHAKRLDREVQEISAEMMRQLRSYTWPGNVRELEGIIQRALISSSGPVLELAGPLLPHEFDDGTPKIISSTITDLHLVEREHILSVLEDTRWKISGESGAAARLSIPPSTLRSKMKKLGITRPH